MTGLCRFDALLLWRNRFARLSPCAARIQPAVERVDQQMMTPKAAPSFRPQRLRNTLSLLCPTGAGCEGDGLREGPDSSCVIADITSRSRGANRARGVAVIRSSEKQRATADVVGSNPPKTRWLPLDHRRSSLRSSRRQCWSPRAATASREAHSCNCRRPTTTARCRLRSRRGS
jgi:hypothetical protein